VGERWATVMGGRKKKREECTGRRQCGGFCTPGGRGIEAAARWRHRVGVRVAVGVCDISGTGVYSWR
jgi:hypothetical protein